MPQHRFKKLNNGVWNPFEGTVGFSQQFWGEHIYAIQSDIPPTESVFAALDKSNATEVHTKMKISRGYDTFCPVQCGIADDKNPRIFFGGTASVTEDVFTQTLNRDDSFLFSKIAGETDGYFGYYIGGYYGQTGFNEIIAFKSSNGNASGYTVGQPILWRISSDVTGYIEAPDLEIYLVYSVRDDCYYWCVRSILNDYYRYWLCEYGYAVYAEDDDTGEKEEDTDMITRGQPPAISALQTGFISLYKMDLNGLRQLASDMWGTGFLNSINKFFGDETPYESIISLSIFPWADYMPSGTDTNLKIGNVTLSDVQGEKISSQFYDVELGGMTVPYEYLNGLDYSPYTTVELYLPAIGVVGLPVSIVMGKYVSVAYRIDLLSGQCCAYVEVYDNSSKSSGIGVLQRHIGNIRCLCPMSSSDGSKLFDTLINGVTTGRAALSKNMFKEDISQHGSYAGNSAMLQRLSPVLYIRRPTDVTPSEYNLYQGYICNKVLNLGTLHGFTQVADINLGIEGASQEDLDEIETLLKEGVIL